MSTSAMNPGPTPPNEPSQPNSPPNEFEAPKTSSSKGAGLTPAIGAIILVAVMVAAGAGTYFAFNTSAGNKSTNTIQCTPPTLSIPGCPTPTGQTYTGASLYSPVLAGQTGTALTFSASIPSTDGSVTSSYFTFGDGNSTHSSSATVVHTYQNAGIFFVSVKANSTNGNFYTNYNALTTVSITQSSLFQQPYQPVLTGGAVGTSSATIPTSGSLQLRGIVSSPPPNTAYTVKNTTFTTPNTANLSIALSTNPNTASGTTANITAKAGSGNGIFTVNFQALTISASGPNEVTTMSFSVGIGVQVKINPVSPPPAKGVVNNYELIPGGSYSEDPAVDYETAGTEVLYNVVQTLVAYNGSVAGPDPNDYVPNLATCVPGTAYCNDLYGNSLVSGGGSTFTFVINPSATFYVPSGDINSTGSKIPQTMSVWPNDVVFSFARTCLFVTVGPNPGWIQCQALLPGFSNTPTHILNAVVMNDTAAGCPSLAKAPHGCVTFITTSSGTNWPEFLEFLVDGYGGGIVSCRYATSIGAGLPGWSCGATSNPTGLSDMLWAPYQNGLSTTGSDYGSPSGPYANGIAKMRWSLVGSGPYYVSGFNVGASYTLQANPNWQGTGCTWTGCIPAKFPVQTVYTTWESTPTPGEIALENGKADFASVPATDFGVVLKPLLESGAVTLTSATGLSIFFSNFDFNFSASGAQGYLPPGTTLTATSTIMQDLAFRQFLVHAYPYATVQNQFNTVDGISLNVLYGGAIPKYMGNYYPTNVSFDYSDPGSGGGAGAWWTNVTNEPGGYAKTQCTATTPCTFPFLSYQGAPLQDKINQLWISDISKYSGGAVNAVEQDLSFGKLVGNSFKSPGNNPMPMYELGWAPDYPDPTDYVVPMYMPDQSYTYGDAIAEGFAVSAYQGACPTGFEWKVQAVTMACQGAAYTEMVKLMVKASNDTNLPERALLYNEVEHIAQQLAIFAPNPGQASTIWVASNWILPSTLNINPTIGGGGDNTFFMMQYSS